jgi:hypothetical protein
MHEHLAPLDTEPASVHAPYITYPHGQYRHEDAAHRHAALLVPLRGVSLGAYDRRVVHWLAGWDVPVVAVVVSLFWRVRHAAAQTSRGGGQSR